jgi:hypothetical protein
MRGLRRYEKRTVVVHHSGPSIRGVLLHAYRDCFVLAHAKSLDDDADLGGEVVVPRAPGVWMQAHVPEPTE